tara:strand:- start:69 stop:359 length:291 start_codon:yes stop_codon:yes gene_type:complete
MFVSQMNGSAGSVMVETTHKRGFTAEELAASCAAKIISVAASADPVIRQQAEAFQSTIEQVVLMYLQQTAKSERTTIYNLLLDAGETALAEQIRRL